MVPEAQVLLVAQEEKLVTAQVQLMLLVELVSSKINNINTK